MPNLPVDQRRARIVQAAVRVLAEEGLGRATTRRIAAEAGMPLGALHYCFASKDDLLAAVLEAVVEEISGIATAAVDPARGLDAAIEASALAFWGHVEATPGLQTMQYELTLHALRSPESAWLAAWQYDRYVDVAAGVYRAAARAAGERPAVPYADIASFAVAGLDGLIIQHLAHRDAARSRAAVARLVRATRALADPRPTATPARRRAVTRRRTLDAASR